MTWKILITSSFYDELCQDGKKMLEDKGCILEVNHKKEPFYTFDELVKTIGDKDAAIIGLDDWNESIFKNAPKLKCIAKFGVGVDNIDLLKAKEYGIKVINARGGNSNAVAELAVGFILNSLRSISTLDCQLKNGNWQRHIGEELIGKTVGLLGFGSIAQKVAKKLSGFDVHMIACDICPNFKAAAALGVELTTSECVLSESDIVSIHIPGSKENHYFLNAQTIGQMKKGSYLINTARGTIVDPDALCDAIESGHLAGAALDVYEVEPLPIGSRLVKYPQILTMPHGGSETFDVYKNISVITAKGVLDVLEGREPENWLNK